LSPLQLLNTSKKKKPKIIKKADNLKETLSSHINLQRQTGGTAALLYLHFHLNIDPPHKLVCV
jgi:hypothetical protein